MRTCSTCKRPYEPVNAQQRYCTSTCKERMLGSRRRVKRGTTAERGYGPAHRKLRAQWQPIVDAGDAACARCGQHIPPGTAWQLDHNDADRSQYIGPSHRTCNLSAGAVKGNRERVTGQVFSSRPRIV